MSNGEAYLKLSGKKKDLNNCWLHQYRLTRGKICRHSFEFILVSGYFISSLCWTDSCDNIFYLSNDQYSISSADQSEMLSEWILIAVTLNFPQRRLTGQRLFPVPLREILLARFSLKGCDWLWAELPSVQPAVGYPPLYLPLSASKNPLPTSFTTWAGSCRVNV